MGYWWGYGMISALTLADVFSIDLRAPSPTNIREGITPSSEQLITRDLFPATILTKQEQLRTPSSHEYQP